MIAMAVNWLLMTLVIFITFKLVPGLEAKKNTTYFWVALVFGIIHAVVWGLFGGLFTAISIFTLGLAWWAVNSAILYLTGLLVEGFKAKSAGAIFSGALIIGFLSLLFRHLIF